MCVCVCVCVCVFHTLLHFIMSSYMPYEHSSPIVGVCMPHNIIRFFQDK